MISILLLFLLIVISTKYAHSAIELAYLMGKKYTKTRGDLLGKITAVACAANIAETQAKTELIQKILHSNYLEDAEIHL